MPPPHPDHPTPAHAQRDADVPVAQLFGVADVDGSNGQQVAMSVPETMADEEGVLPIGALVVLADHALGHRLSDSLAPDERMVTSHMHIELVRPPQPRVNHFVGESQEVHRVPGSGFSRGHIRNPAGELVALISARFALFPAEDTQGGAVHDFTPQADDLPEAPGPTSGLAIAPIHRLLGTRLRTESRGRVEVDFVAAPELATSNRAYTVGSAR